MSSVNPAPQQNNPWFGSTMALLGIMVGFVAANLYGNSFSFAAPQPPSAPAAPAGQEAPAPNNATPPTVDDDAVLGSDSATVTIIEFTDYQCPFCARHFTETFDDIRKDYIDTGKVKYVSRDFPLGFHPLAVPAAVAAECADDQGKFWEMHDKLFATHGTWSGQNDILPTVKQYAKDLGLNTADFDACVDSNKYAEEVQKDMDDGTASGVQGTPGFWVLGPDDKSQFISGAVPYAQFRQAIDSML